MRAPMPTVSSDDLFYSINHGPIHFLQLSEFGIESGGREALIVPEMLRASLWKPC